MPDITLNDRVRLSIEGSIAHVTLTRSDKHNGVDLAMLEAVREARRRIGKTRGIRGVIIDGEGPSFCAGLDFKSMLGDRSKALWSYLQLWWPFRNHFQDWSVGWRRLPLPVVAVMHGNCFGAGLQLGLGADIRIATPDASLSMMEAKWGLVPDMGGVLLMRELLPIDSAKEFTMTGRIVSGQEAKALGLVTHVSDDPLAMARRILSEMESRSPDAVGAGKLLLQAAWRAGDWRALRAERGWQRRVMGFRNQRIAMARNRKGEEIPFADRGI